MKKIQKNKIFLICCVLILICVFSFSTFAFFGGVPVVEYRIPTSLEAGDHVSVYNPTGGEGASYLASDEGWYIYSKPQGVFGFVNSAVPSVSESLLDDRYFEYDFELYSDANVGPRCYITFANGEYYNDSTGSFSSIALCGYSIRYNLNSNSIIVQHVRNNTIMNTTLVNPIVYQLPFTFEETNYTIPFAIQVDTYESRFELYYVNPFTDEYILLDDTLAVKDADFNIFRFAIFDEVESTVLLENPRINNYGRLFSDAYQEGFDAGEVHGKSIGYNQGKREGYSLGVIDGKALGYDVGYDVGYDAGYISGTESTGFYLDIPSIINSIFGGTSTILSGFLDWEIFGINVLGVLVAIVVVSIVVFVVKKLRS